LLGEQELVVKKLGPLLASLDCYLGASILGDGRIALLVDPGALVDAPARRRRREPVEVEVPTNGASPNGRATKILVVEDSFTVRELQRSILEAAGYAVATARDGRDALERLAADEEIRLVVTDLEMPEMDGIELIKTIRADPERSELPVVIVTSRSTDEDRQRGL